MKEKAHKPIQIFTTGGTIDKVYFDAKSHYQVGEPSVYDMFADINPVISYQVQSLLKKDSLELTDADRALIAKHVSACQLQKIIITHGTDTMVKTAHALSDISDKTIVLTGAMRPAIFKNSDALFNLGCAVAAVQTLSSGIYITMNGAVFPYDGVKKNVAKGQFLWA